jgi:hypothetical protein
MALTERQRQQIRAAAREVDPEQMRIIRQLSPAQRTEIALSMIRAGEAAAVHRLRQRHPELSPDEALRRVRSQR